MMQSTRYQLKNRNNILICIPPLLTTDVLNCMYASALTLHCLPN